MRGPGTRLETPRYEGLADYFGLTGLKKYAATADERRISGEDPGRCGDRNPPG